MNTIKFNSEFIPLIKMGRKTSTTRLHDQPEYQVYDVLKIKDGKVKILIKSVTQARLCELTKIKDLPQKEAFQDHFEMIHTLKEIYPKATQNSPVCIYEFEVIK